MRQIARALRSKPFGPKPPPLSVDILRQQLASMSPEDRETTQRLLANEPALREALETSNAFDKPQDLSSLVTEVLESVESPKDLDPPFWSSVKELIKETSGHRNIDKRVDNVPLFVRLFQLARDLDEPERSELLYRTGSYIYRLKMLRFDPINEAEYLDALSKYSKPIKAVTLWKSRKDRQEVADSIYWYDIGILYHLEANLVTSANQLAEEMMQKFGYVSPRSLCELIKANKDSEIKQYWLDRLLGAERVPEAEDFTQKQNYTTQQLAALFTSLLASGSWSLASKLVAGADFKPTFESTPVKSTRDGDLNELASAIIERDPNCLMDSAFFAFWILNHLKAGNTSEAQDILNMARQEGIVFPQEQAIKLVKSFEKAGAAKEAQSLVSEHETPNMAVEYIDHLAKTRPQDIASYIDAINCDLTPELAEKILEHGGQIKLPLVDLCMNHSCWKQFWPLLRDGTPLAIGEVPTTREALDKMLRSETYSPSLNLFETVLQACIVQGDLAAVVAVLYYMERKHGLLPNRLLFSSIKAAVGSGPQKRSKVSKSDLPWPREGPLAQPVSIQKVADYLKVDTNEAKAIAQGWP